MRRGYESAALMNGDSALVRVLGTLLLCALHHVRVREGGTLHPRRDRTRTQPCCRPDFEILSPQGCVTQTSVVYKPLSLQSFVLQQLKLTKSAGEPRVERARGEAGDVVREGKGLALGQGDPWGLLRTSAFAE